MYRTFIVAMTKSTLPKSAKLCKKPAARASKLWLALSLLTWEYLSLAQEEAVKTAAPVAGGAGAPAGAGYMNFLLLGGMFFFMWLFIIRPQAKRQKEHKSFLEKLVTGQEVVTSGGIIGKITSVQDTVVTLDIGASTVRVLKSAVSGELGKPQVAAQ